MIRESAARPHPTIAYVNGKFFTLDPAREWATALLVIDGRIAAVGSEAEVRAAAPADVMTIDLGGRMAMPGIHDAHTHLLASGLKFRIECRLDVNPTTGQILAGLCDCAKCRGRRLSGWLIGGEYNSNLLQAGELDRALLDRQFPDTPVFLYDYSIHSGFANSRALELAGIDETTPDPRGGRIVRRPDSNEPTGELVERATWAVLRAVPDYEPDVYREAMVWAIQTAHRFGITSVQEASGSRPELEVLKQLESEGALKLHVAAHLVWMEEAFSRGASQEDMNQLIARRNDYESAHVHTRFVKCWLDGAPLPPHFTQSNLDPDTGEPDQSKILIDKETLIEGLRVFDREGLTLKMHCGGTGAVRIAVEAVEAVRRENGADGPWHEVAHALFVADEDMPRFRALNLVAEMSPALWHVRTPELAALDAGCKFATLNAAGVHVTIGSDWIITENPNLFPALQGMLDRGTESVELATALRMMTLAGAEAAGFDGWTGSLEIGKSADFIVLDRNLFEVPMREVGETNVVRTVFEGETVYVVD